jgi:VanZ family protein
LQQAWARCSHQPWPALGAEQRADSVANGLLYLPAGALLTLAFLRRGAAPAARTAAMLAATAVGCTLAVTVEFAQIFFPQRTT